MNRSIRARSRAAGRPDPSISPAESGPLGPLEALAERLAGEMAGEWAAGKRPPAEEFLGRHRELFDHPESALRLIYEELCLREGLGQAVEPREFRRRFPAWGDDLDRLFSFHRLVGSPPEASVFPVPGDEFGGFRLLKELGRGALGRVFLATQNELADRPVVLKVTPGGGEEHLTLARLQHTHIIPINGAQEVPEANLRAICMPYLGGTTLERLLEGIDDRGAGGGGRSGRSLLDGLDRAQADSPIILPARGPARGLLGRSSYDRAVCWIGACLADALHYAHERGLLHLDLKPSNVLMAADGQPLLLDFHLARPPIDPGSASPAWIGGTPAYMSPEQAAVLASVRRGGGPPVAVDGRSDVYSLGLLLHEALGGTIPPPGGAIPPLVAGPGLPRGLASILRKCLARDPAERYPDAAELAADLRRNLADLPLRGVAEPGIAERWRKLRRRQPHAPAMAGLLAVSLAAVLIVGVSAASHVVRLRQDAARDLAEGRSLLGDSRHAEAGRVLARGLASIGGIPGGRGLADALGGQLRLARRGELAGRLREVAGRVRFLFAAESIPPGLMRAVSGRCLEIWEARDRILPSRGSGLSPGLERQIRADLSDLVVLWADFHVRLAAPAGREGARREALRVLDQAEAALPPSPLLGRERQAQASALGLDYIARAAGRAAEAFLPRSDEDHRALGLSLFRAGRFGDASAEFRRVLDARPQDFWANYFEGICAFREGRHRDAEGSFRACVALAPGSAEGYYNRARARQELGESDRALADYDRALLLDPTLAAAAMNRGILHHQRGRVVEALADLRKAQALGADPAAIEYNLALVASARGDDPASRVHAERALRHDPGHSGARQLLDRPRDPRPSARD